MEDVYLHQQKAVEKLQILQLFIMFSQILPEFLDPRSAERGYPVVGTWQRNDCRGTLGQDRRRSFRIEASRPVDRQKVFPGIVFHKRLSGAMPQGRLGTTGMYSCPLNGADILSCS